MVRLEWPLGHRLGEVKADAQEQGGTRFKMGNLCRQTPSSKVLCGMVVLKVALIEWRRSRVA